jgi:hypothetical protein
MLPPVAQLMSLLRLAVEALRAADSENAVGTTSAIPIFPQLAPEQADHERISGH